MNKDILANKKAIQKSKEKNQSRKKKSPNEMKVTSVKKYDVYNLEMVIAIAFRICSKESILFRQFVINEICAAKKGNPITLFFSCDKGSNLWYS